MRSMPKSVTVKLYTKVKEEKETADGIKYTNHTSFHSGNREASIVLDVDIDGIFHRLASRAASSKTGKCQFMRGLIKATRVSFKDTPLSQPVTDQQRATGFVAKRS